MKYVIARNASGRPTLQHAVRDTETTMCGYYIGEWTRFWSNQRMTQMFCKRCKGLGQ
jgi:hypothetical protein